MFSFSFSSRGTLQITVRNCFLDFCLLRTLRERGKGGRGPSSSYDPRCSDFDNNYASLPTDVLLEWPRVNEGVRHEGGREGGKREGRGWEGGRSWDRSPLSLVQSVQ